MVLVALIIALVLAVIAAIQGPTSTRLVAVAVIILAAIQMIGTKAAF